MSTTNLGASHAPRSRWKNFVLIGERVVAIDTGSADSERRTARPLWPEVARLTLAGRAGRTLSAGLCRPLRSTTRACSGVAATPGSLYMVFPETGDVVADDLIVGGIGTDALARGGHVQEIFDRVASSQQR